MKLPGDFTRGVIRENPVFVLSLGMCPILATTTSVFNALGMGAAVTFVLLGSNILVSMLRKFIPAQIRIAAYIVIIASFVTIVDLVMHAYLPALHANLGIFVPLIVVNCIILGRAEGFASKKTVWRSILDALGMGLGFIIALLVLSSIREILGAGTWLGSRVMPLKFRPAVGMLMSPGAFLSLGLLMALYKKLKLSGR